MDTTFLEALETTEKGAKRFKIRVISAGVSKNGNYYSPAALREAAPLFEGVRVLVRSDEEHIQGKGKDFRNLIGRLANPRFIESTAEIQADFELIEPNGAIAVKLREAFEGGMTGLFGFSIDAAALAKPARINGQTVREACKITQVKSVDLIVEPGANGGIIDFIEAMNEEGQTMSEKEKETKEETNVQEAAPAITAQEIDDKIRMVEARANAKATIAASSLPEMAKTRLKKHFETLADFKEADVETAIKDELDYLAKFTEANVKDLGAGRAAVTKDRLETVSERLDAFFDEGHKDHRQALSFKEAYVDLTGDAKVSGRVENFTEALTSTSFNNVLGDAITRRLVKEYNNKTQLDAWRKFASIVPVSDFREQKRVRMGGYGDLAAVSEAAAYAAVTSPTDDVAKYSASKRGGLGLCKQTEPINNDWGESLKSVLRSLMPMRLVEFVMTRAGFKKDKPTGEITKAERGKILSVLKGLKFTVSKVGDYNCAVVTSGGVSVKELTPCCEAKKKKGLYFVGETIDVDALTGGFNLQAAFSTAYAAATSASHDGNRQ